MRFLLIIGCAACAAFAVPNAAHSQSRDTTAAKARPSTTSLVVTPACCSVVRIDAKQSLVSARETATGFTFRFTVKSRRLLATLKISQPVWADFAAKTVKLKATDVQPCCAIVESPPPPEPGTLGVPQEQQ